MMKRLRHRWPIGLGLFCVGALLCVMASGTTEIGTNATSPNQIALTAATTGPFPLPLWTDTVGSIAVSSPTTGVIDGITAIVFASENGYLYVVDATTGANLPGWPQPVILSGSSTTAIESSPTVAYLDGPSKPPTIVIGAGSTYAQKQQGGLVAFNADGSIRFTFQTRDIYNEWSGSSTPGPDGYNEAVFSTPAVGDITGNGQMDIVFGSYDHRLYAVTKTGKLVPGFPFETEDTIWSSAALHHVRGKASLDDIFIGGDATGRRNCYGGFVYDFTYKANKPSIVWQHCENQTIWSSPAVGVINSSGRVAVVVGTGFGEPAPFKSDTNKVFAFYANNGARVPGWPVTTTGPSFGSPAIGNIGPSGQPGVVDTSWCTSCAASPGQSKVFAWSGNGSLIWSQTIGGAQDFGSPILVDLTGTGINDVLVGSASGLFPLDGVTGTFLYNSTSTTGINTCSVQTTPMVLNVPGVAPSGGWHLFETCGGPKELIATGRLINYPLPATPGVNPPWPMWRGDAAHDGSP